MGLYLRAFLVSVLVVGVMYSIFEFWRANSLGSASSSVDKVIKMENSSIFGFESKDILNRNVNVSDFMGFGVIVHFWASWCGPCVKEMPSLLRLVRSQGGKIKLIAISEDEVEQDVFAFFKAFPELHELESRGDAFVLIDHAGQIMKKYGTDKLPETYIANRKHKLVRKFAGEVDWESKEALSVIKTIGL